MTMLNPFPGIQNRFVQSDQPGVIVDHVQHDLKTALHQRAVNQTGVHFQIADLLIGHAFLLRIRQDQRMNRQMG
ncbi:hypothetical protein QEP77_05660 [Serratia sp. B1]|nr:hypothetical protein QEP77_05660 [Serratia sp. B1]